MPQVRLSIARRRKACVERTREGRRRGRLGLGALFAALACLCCGGSTTLEGSLTEILDLRFTSVEVSVTDSAVIVEYWRPKGDGQDIVLKLVTYVAPTAVVPGQAIDLSPAPDGSARATVTRSVADDPIHTLADIKRGTLTLDEVPQVDKPASGNFRVTLGEGGDAGKGRTAFGDFYTAKVVPGN